jgi:O-antigen/teichoic acid export membrane protein
MLEATADQIKKAAYPSVLGIIAKHSRRVFAGKCSFILLGFGTSALLARILGPSSLGMYQLGLTVLLVSSIFSVAGLDRGLVRFLPILLMKSSSEARALIAFNILSCLGFSIVLATALYFVAPLLSVHYFHSPEMTKVLRAFSAYLPVISVFRIVSGAVIGIKRADMHSNAENVLSPIIFLILLLAIYFSDGVLISCIFALSISHVVGAFALSWFLLKKLARTPKASERSLSLGRFVSFSADVMLIGLIYFLLGHMDTLMLGYFVAKSEVGIYSVALKVATLVIFGLEVLLPVVRPHFSELSEKKDFKTIEALFKTVTKWLLYSGFGLFALVFILRFEVLNVFGPGFVAGGSILGILGVGSLANVASGPTGQLLVMTGKQKWEMINTTMMVFINFALNLYLIPRMGAIGAAIATVVSISAINAAKLIEVYHLYDIHPYSAKMLKGVVPIFSACLVCVFIRWVAFEVGMGFMSIMVLAGVSFVIVAIIGMWFLTFDEEDKMLFAIARRG